MVAVVAPLSRKPLGKLNIAMEQLTKPKNDFQTLKTGEVEVAMFFFFSQGFWMVFCCLV